MKRLFSFLLVFCLLFSLAAAETTLDPNEARGITINRAGLNPVIEGESPTTGRKLADLEYIDGFAGQVITTRYMPMLVQIDNAGGGVNTEAFGKRAPWGGLYTDIIYEAPLYKGGDTRLTYVFSDYIPTAVGPLRSARLFHAWLREEWDCGFIYYGQQEYAKTSVPEQFKELGANKKGILFPGTVGINKPWKQYFGVREPLKNPHNKTVDAAAVSTLIPDDFVAANHTWLFTDTVPEGGDDASVIHVTWGKKEFNNELEWDEDEQCYYRYMLVDAKGNQYSDYDTGEAITFNNIIVQFTDMEWVMTDAPKPTVIGTGNADFFMGGKHFAGVWEREKMSSRTVFYGADGNEIELQRGRTLIIVMEKNMDTRSISYE